MKAQIHPETYPVIYHDITTGSEFFSTSTVKGTQTKEVDGVTYFVIPVEISASSHPFYTGEQKFVDSASRIQKFQKKQDTASQYKVTVKKKVDEKKKADEAPKTLREMLMGA